MLTVALSTGPGQPVPVPLCLRLSHKLNFNHFLIVSSGAGNTSYSIVFVIRVKEMVDSLVVCPELGRSLSQTPINV